MHIDANSMHAYARIYMHILWYTLIYYDCLILSHVSWFAVTKWQPLQNDFLRLLQCWVNMILGTEIHEEGNNCMLKAMMSIVECSPKYRKIQAKQNQRPKYSEKKSLDLQLQNDYLYKMTYLDFCNSESTWFQERKFTSGWNNCMLKAMMTIHESTMA